jgi:hypothetical protein
MAYPAPQSGSVGMVQTGLTSVREVWRAKPAHPPPPAGGRGLPSVASEEAWMASPSTKKPTQPWVALDGQAGVAEIETPLRIGLKR